MPHQSEGRSHPERVTVRRNRFIIENSALTLTIGMSGDIMRKVAFALVSALLMIVVGDALAPDAPAQSQPPDASSAEVPPVGEFGDVAAARFAPAALEMERIAASNSMAEEEQQAAMINAVRQVGRKLQGFHQIALAHQADTGLPQRIEVAAEQHVAEA
ncbi:hypothetical protein A9D14_05730 [Croceicoccus marinus]|uniref:DUF4168 domain-containing protein n=2 Tax=Croceicoccus marinus TaxID=450378 RepID=A0A1Z1FAK5_9SPHN|nr:hypothetical protein A9D14_05730 [Croceicoccus marinus]